MLLCMLSACCSTMAYFGNASFPVWQIKTREDDDSLVFEVKCSQLYIQTHLKQAYLVIHLILSKECLCVSLLSIGWAGSVKVRETSHSTQGLQIKQQKACGDMSSLLSVSSKFMIVVLFGVGRSQVNPKIALWVQYWLPGLFITQSQTHLRFSYQATSFLHMKHKKLKSTD